MVRVKQIKEDGQTVLIEPERLQKLKKEEPEVIEITYNQAKKLFKTDEPKKERTEKQKETAQKLVEMNRIKWEMKKKEREEEDKLRQAELEAQRTRIVIKPKRVYPSRKKHLPAKDEDITDGSSEEENTEEDSIQVKKKAPATKTKTIEKNLQKMQAIEEVLQKVKAQPANKYAEMMSRYFKN